MQQNAFDSAGRVLARTSEQALAGGDGGGLCAVRRANLLEQRGDVLLHHDEADAELTGYVGIGESARDRLEDFTLPWRKPGHGRILAEEPPHVVGKASLAVRDRANRRDH